MSKNAPVVPRCRAQGSSAESKAGKAAVEVGDGAEQSLVDLEMEVDLVGRAVVPGGMGPVVVVVDEEVGADRVELSGARDHPIAAADSLFEGAEEPLDAAIGPGMGDAGAGVADAVLVEEGGEVGGNEAGAVVGEDPRGCAMFGEGFGESRADGFCGRTGDAPEQDEPAAEVVDDAKHPDREDAEDKDEGEVDAQPFQGVYLRFDFA